MAVGGMPRGLASPQWTWTGHREHPRAWCGCGGGHPGAWPPPKGHGVTTGDTPGLVWPWGTPWGLAVPQRRWPSAEGPQAGGHSRVLPAWRRARAPSPPHLAVDAVGVVALGALGAGQEVALGPAPEAATHHAHVLGEKDGERSWGWGGQELGGTEVCPAHLSVHYLHEHELVGVGEENDCVLHRVIVVLILLLAGRALHISELGRSGGLSTETPPGSGQLRGNTSHRLVSNWRGTGTHQGATDPPQLSACGVKPPDQQNRDPPTP